MTRNTIVGAPSKFDLMIAFFDEPNSKLFGGRRSVSFTIEGRSCLGIRHRIEVVINQISWEDGSGDVKARP